MKTAVFELRALQDRWYIQRYIASRDWLWVDADNVSLYEGRWDEEYWDLASRFEMLPGPGGGQIFGDGYAYEIEEYHYWERSSGGEYVRYVPLTLRQRRTPGAFRELFSDRRRYDLSVFGGATKRDLEQNETETWQLHYFEGPELPSTARVVRATLRQAYYDISYSMPENLPTVLYDWWDLPRPWPPPADPAQAREQLRRIFDQPLRPFAQYRFSGWPSDPPEIDRRVVTLELPPEAVRERLQSGRPLWMRVALQPRPADLVAPPSDPPGYWFQAHAGVTIDDVSLLNRELANPILTIDYTDDPSRQRTIVHVAKREVARRRAPSVTMTLTR